MQVIGAVQRAARPEHRRHVRRRHHAGRAAQALEGRTARCPTTWNTAFPAWATRSPAAMGIKMAEPERDVICMLGDGSYMMANSELATAVMMGIKIHRRGHRQSRLRLHQPAADGDRRGRVQQPAGPRRTTRPVARSTSPPMPPRWAPTRVKVGSHRRARRRRWRDAREPTGPSRHRHRHRSLSLDRSGRRIGGMWRCRRSRTARRFARPARPTRTERQAKRSRLRARDSHEREDRHLPDCLAERRPAGPDRRLIRWSRRCGRRARSAISGSSAAGGCRLTPKGCGAYLETYDIALCGGWCSGNLLVNDCRDRNARQCASRSSSSWR